jgi:RNA polymerase sigma-70 factor (ECF subfamily)
VTNGDVTALQALLTEGVTASTDGGGRARAAPRPVHGREAVGRFPLAVTNRARGGL